MEGAINFDQLSRPCLELIGRENRYRVFADLERRPGYFAQAFDHRLQDQVTCLVFHLTPPPQRAERDIDPLVDGWPRYGARALCVASPETWIKLPLPASELCRSRGRELRDPKRAHPARQALLSMSTAPPGLPPRLAPSAGLVVVQASRRAMRIQRTKAMLATASAHLADLRRHGQGPR